MFRSLSDIENAVLEATDGEIGRCKDFLFDDEHWAIRYMVADTHKWLIGRKVLIAPLVLGVPDWDGKRFPVRLSKEQIENSPPLQSDMPVSRQYETLLLNYYQLPHYWTSPGSWDTVPIPIPQTNRDAPRPELSKVEQENHLRSQKAVRGYKIQASDGAIGHVEDFLADHENWVIKYLVVDTRNWLPGRKVIIAPHWADTIDWVAKAVHLNVTRELVENAPESIPTTAIDRDYEVTLHKHYDYPFYW